MTVVTIAVSPTVRIDEFPVGGSVGFGIAVGIKVGLGMRVGLGAKVGVGIAVGLGAALDEATTAVGEGIRAGVGVKVWVSEGIAGKTCEPSANTVKFRVIVFRIPAESRVFMEIVWGPGVSLLEGRYVQPPALSAVTSVCIFSGE